MLSIQSQIDSLSSTYEAKLQILIDKIKAKTYNDIVANVYMKYDGVGVHLAHKTLNWTNFVTVYFERSRTYSDPTAGFKFSFSHGSGGWNDAPDMEILKATQDMFNIVEDINYVFVESESEIRSLLKMTSELNNLYDKKSDIEMAKKEEEVLSQYKDTHVKLTKEMLREMLLDQNVKAINCVYVSGSGNYDVTISEKGYRRKSFYINSNSYSFKDIEKYVETNNVFIKN